MSEELIEQINKKFNEKIKKFDCDSFGCNCEEMANDLSPFLNDAIRRVLERTVTDTCEGQPIEIDIGMVGDFLKQIDELNK